MKIRALLEKKKKKRKAGGLRGFFISLGVEARRLTFGAATTTFFTLQRTRPLHLFLLSLSAFSCFRC